MKSWWALFSTQPLLAFKEIPLFLWIVFAALGALVLVFGQANSPEDPDKTSISSPVEIDTLIPSHLSAATIELQNYKSLDSFLGPYAVVDLYAARSDGEGRARLIAQRVKMVRSPKDPSQFMILVPPSKVELLYNPHSVYFASLQNRAASGTEFEKPPAPAKKRSIIRFEREGS